MKITSNLNEYNTDQFVDSLKKSLQNFNYSEQEGIGNHLLGVSGKSSEARKETSRDAKNKSEN